MRRVLSDVWWLLALCGALDAAHAGMNLLMLDPSLTLRTLGRAGAVWDMGILALMAGIFAIGAGLWSLGKDSCWLLSLHGLALGAFGVIAVSPLVRGPLSFRPVSLLFALMAASIGAFAWKTAQKQRQGARERWFLIASGAASIGFAISFIAVGFRLIRFEPPAFFIWMSSYFAFCAVFMFWLGFRMRRSAFAQIGPLSPLPNPRPAH